MLQFPPFPVVFKCFGGGWSCEMGGILGDLRLENPRDFSVLVGFGTCSPVPPFSLSFQGLGIPG